MTSESRLPEISFYRIAVILQAATDDGNHLLPNSMFRYHTIIEFIYDIKSALMPADEGTAAIYCKAAINFSRESCKDYHSASVSLS